MPIEIDDAEVGTVVVEDLPYFIVVRIVEGGVVGLLELNAIEFRGGIEHALSAIVEDEVL